MFQITHNIESTGIIQFIFVLSSGFLTLQVYKGLIKHFNKKLFKSCNIISYWWSTQAMGKLLSWL